MAQFANLILLPSHCAVAWSHGRFRYTSSARWMDLMKHLERVGNEASQGKRDPYATASFLVDDRTLDRLHCIMLEIQEEDNETGHVDDAVNSVVTACEKASEMMG